MDLLNDFFKKTFNAEPTFTPDPSVQDNDLSEIAKQSHLKNRLSNEYDFLELTPANISTYELGFMAGVMYATGEQLKLMEKHEATRNESPTVFLNQPENETP